MQTNKQSNKSLTDRFGDNLVQALDALSYGAAKNIAGAIFLFSS